VDAIDLLSPTNTFAFSPLQADDHDCGPLAYLADLITDICRGAKQPHQGPDQDDDGAGDPEHYE